LTREEYSYSGTSGKVTDWHKVDSTYAVLSSKLDTFITRVMKDFTPHTETMRLTLLKSKDKEMKDAEKLASDGQLVSSRRKYLGIYRSSQLFEAGYNAALLYEAMEEYDEALSLMKEVYKNSGDSRAREKVKALEKEVEAAARLRSQKKK
ncbi:MAG: hypothetical protein II837_05890, partial [Treponema sp.]|nr:hypothetical protein [Treponema sp.]